MRIESLIKHIEIDSLSQKIGTWSSARPNGELLVTAPPYDSPRPEVQDSPSWDLYDVQPAVIATAQNYADRSWGPQVGLRVGLIAITEIDMSRVVGEVRTGRVSPGNGTWWYHQFDGLVGEMPDFPGLLNGGSVDWGDGQSTTLDSVLSAVEHEYNTVGTYDVRLSLQFASAENFAWSGPMSATRRLTIN